MKDRAVLIFDQLEKANQFVVQKWKQIRQEAIEARGKFSVAISGGKTPLALYKKLSESKNLPWGKTHIFWADERLVPWDSAESNYRLIKESFLDRIAIPEENIHPIFIDKAAESSAQKYQQDIESFFNLGKNEFAEFDLIILGIGSDGHTASLFPGSNSLLEKRKQVVSDNSGSLKNKRISLSLELINSSRNVIFLVTGNKKAEIIRDVINKEGPSLPASLVCPGKGKLFFVLDKQAGSLLEKGSTK